MPQAMHRSSLHDDVREERAVKRYRLDGERYSERTRLALTAFARRFGREDNDTLVAGALAGQLGDGNGWTAAVTIRSFVRRGWIVEAHDKRSELASWIVHYRITDEGLRVLRALDEQYKGEWCPDCSGTTTVRHAERHFFAMPEGMCETCRGTRLRRRAVA